MTGALTSLIGKRLNGMIHISNKPRSGALTQERTRTLRLVLVDTNSVTNVRALADRRRNRATNNVSKGQDSTVRMTQGRSNTTRVIVITIIIRGITHVRAIGNTRRLLMNNIR